MRPGPSDPPSARAHAGQIPDESDLCVACGMCCDGTFLSWAPVGPDDDRVGLQRVGHPVLDSPTRGEHFTLPCPALVDKCCTVYENRPSICPTYRCALLDEFARGKVDATQAVEIIRSTLEVRDRVREAIDRRLESASPRSLFESYSELQAIHDAARDPVAARRDDADLLLDIALLRQSLRRHFEADDPPARAVDARFS